MISLQKNQTTKEATRASKNEKKNRPKEITGTIRKETRERETHQEDHGPGAMGRLIDEWVDAEDENGDKTTSPREGKRQNAPRRTIETSEQIELIAEEERRKCTKKQ